VLVFPKEHLSMVAPVEHMEKALLKISPGDPWHTLLLPPLPLLDKKRCLSPFLMTLLHS
jgi:hypothetical protein